MYTYVHMHIERYRNMQRKRERESEREHVFHNAEVRYWLLVLWRAPPARNRKPVQDMMNKTLAYCHCILGIYHPLLLLLPLPTVQCATRLNLALQKSICILRV